MKLFNTEWRWLLLPDSSILFWKNLTRQGRFANKPEPKSCL